MDKLIMNRKERKQLVVFEQLKDDKLTKVQASKILGISPRWLRTKYNRFLKEGDRGLTHKNRGKPSPNRLNAKDVALFAKLIKGEWKGFWPTIATDLFEEEYKKKISAESARQIMIAIGEWQVGKRKPYHRKRRPRKTVIGMMIQLDGSPHDWFEGRGPACTLLVFIDDATSQILWLEFVKSESFVAVARATKNYLERYGLPSSIYVDYGSVFSVNTNNPERDKLSQFERAMKELGIRVIHARSPQAKGRVERANQTLQRRLVARMRLAKISSIEEGNIFVQKGNYLQKHNGRFSIDAEKAGNAHLSAKEYNLNNILCQKNIRIVTNDFTISYKTRILQLEKHQPAIVRPKSRVVVYEHLDSSLSIHIGRSKLHFTQIGIGKKGKISPVDYVNSGKGVEVGISLKNPADQASDTDNGPLLTQPQKRRARKSSIKKPKPASETARRWNGSLSKKKQHNPQPKTN